MQTYSGMQVLASRYVTDPVLREHLVEIALTLDQAKQQRFLDRVREALRPPAG